MWEKENVIRLTIVTGNQTFPYNTTTAQPELTTQLPFLDTLGYNAVQVSVTLQYTPPSYPSWTPSDTTLFK
jgi:hypothetical protein